MNRLTKDYKIINIEYDFIGDYDDNIEEFANNQELREAVLNKLGQLEDIEELCEQLKTKVVYYIFAGDIYSKIFNDCDFSYNLERKKILITFEDNELVLVLYLNDYGKTWAFTKEELEK